MYALLAKQAELPRALDAELPEGVVALRRGGMTLVCCLGGERREVAFSRPCKDLLSGETRSVFTLENNACLVLDTEGGACE